MFTVGRWLWSRAIFNRYVINRPATSIRRANFSTQNFLKLKNSRSHLFEYVFTSLISFTTGFVGDGLLTAAIVGSACESPAPKAILSAIRILAEQNESTGTYGVCITFCIMNIFFRTPPSTCKQFYNRAVTLFIRFMKHET